jgi:3',5'-cyclic AMP phosphodiesterase CpdA
LQTSSDQPLSPTLRDAQPSRLKFAHLTDIHLPIPGPPSLEDLLNKRLLGYLSWTRKRQHWHKEEVTVALIDDMKREGCEAALLSGDVVNISLEAEFEAADAFLARAFEGLPLFLCPGNHDAYVRTPWATSLGRLERYMTGARREAPVLRPPKDFEDFPYAVDIGPARLVAANSSPPTAPGLATGALGAMQLARIESELREAGRLGRYRILMLHHPVTAGVVSRRKALDDRHELAAMLARTGVELVLHGHAHVAHFEQIATPSGPAPVLGGASLSHPRGGGDKTPGRYNLYTLERSGDVFRLALDIRQYDPTTGGVASVGSRVYETGALQNSSPA